MYDKGNNLRIEVTINNPRDFKVLKVTQKPQDGEIVQEKKWMPMGKSIANLYRYAEISKSIIKRYLAAIPEVSLDRVPQKESMDISRPRESRGRRYSGFNLLSEETIRVLKTISSGNFLLNGFDNKGIHQRLYKDSETPKVIGKTTRLLAKLRAHGRIKKVPRKNRYYLTSHGREITNILLLFFNKELLNAS